MLRRRSLLAPVAVLSLGVLALGDPPKQKPVDPATPASPAAKPASPAPLKTFLAMRERDEIKPEVMMIVAQQLFRQAATGLVKGDDMPRPPLTKVLDLGKP